MAMAEGGGGHHADGGAGLRCAPRFSLMIRTAKLVGACGEYLCVVRDISSSGVRIKLFHDAPVDTDLFLELGNGTRFAMVPVWQRDGHAGFCFAAPIDVDFFIGEPSRFRRRPLRLRLRRSALVVAGGVHGVAELHDLSRQGARIETAQRLAVRQLVRLEATGLPARVAKVCWRRGDAYGLVFEQTFGLEELARLMWWVQQEGVADRSGPFTAALPLLTGR